MLNNNLPTYKDLPIKTYQDQTIETSNSKIAYYTLKRAWNKHYTPRSRQELLARIREMSGGTLPTHIWRSSRRRLFAVYFSMLRRKEVADESW